MKKKVGNESGYDGGRSEGTPEGIEIFSMFLADTSNRWV